jgi:hypothetical protein
VTFLADQHAARHAVFTGRGAELARFAELVAGRDPGRVFIVHGPGGIGKTSLLLEIARLARQRAVYVDARDLEPHPDAVRAALATDVADAILLLDGWDWLASLDSWLRQTLVPALADGQVLILARRDLPDARWRALPGWGTLVVPVALGQLSDAESSQLLERLRLPAARRADAVAFARGHPLALSLAAEALTRAPELPLRAGESEVVQALVQTWMESVSGAAQRAAFEATAAVHTITEPLLAALVPDGDAHALFRWLAGLSMVQASPAGLHLHDLTSDVISADLRWRNPARWRDLLERARRHLTDSWLRLGGSGRQRVGFEMIYLTRHASWLAPVVSWSDAARPRVELAQPDDHPALCRLVARHEGEDSAALAAEWMRRQPDAVYAYRDAQAEPAGVSVILSLDGGSRQTVGWDPGASAAWRALTALGGLRPGETALLVRHHMARDSYQLPSPLFVEYMATFTRLQILARGIRFGCYIIGNLEYWGPLLGNLGLGALDHSEYTLAGRTYGMFANDFRHIRPMEFFRRLLLAQETGGPAPTTAASSPVIRLARRPFDVAARAALKQLHDDATLAANPLVDSRLAWVDAKSDARSSRVAALRGAVRAAVDALADSPRAGPLADILRRTYVEPAPVQKAVAYDLGLSWSSYRRGLARAITRLVEVLWAQEID